MATWDFPKACEQVWQEMFESEVPKFSTGEEFNAWAAQELATSAQAISAHSFNYSDKSFTRRQNEGFMSCWIIAPQSAEPGIGWCATSASMP